MIVPGSAHALLLASLAGYQIPYSLRFRYSNNASLSRTAGASPTNDKIYTWSGWIKLAYVAANPDYGILFSGYTASNDTGRLTIRIYNSTLQVGGWATNWRITSAVFRDPSAWYHVVIAFDTTNATANDRIKIYVNGTQITAFSTLNNPALNATTGLNNASTAMRLGLDAPAASAYHFDGYMAEVNFIDGQALTPSSFGQTDSATGVWVAKKYSGTYGNNGFYLKFADASAATAAAIGKDSSGNGNNFTPSGISVTSGVTFDQMLDTPTLNYAVMNPLDLSGTAATFQWANLQVTRSGASFAQAYCSIQMSSGKWYCEMTAGADVANLSPGLITGTANAAANRYLGQDSFTYSYDSDGRKVNNASYSLYGNSWTAGDIIGIILDADNGKLYFSKNGTVQNSGDPVAGTNAAFTGLTGPYRFVAAVENGGICDFNFGQRAFSYTPPSGFKALNTTNLPTPSIKKGSLYMDATLRTGTGASASVSSLGFQPDLVWIKGRSGATDHGLYDAVRGVQKQLESNTTTAETTETTGLTAFNSNGYTVGALAQLNTSAATYVDWAWKEGVTPGFDIVTYVGNGTNRTISHNLGAVPKLIVLRSREASSTGRWTVQHGYYGSARYAYLNETFAFDTANANLRWNSTDPTSSVFSIGTSSDVNHTNDNYVGYLWSEIEGFSKFGSYTGNASADGPFVWCGFRPRYILFKNATSTGNWLTFDTARDPYNLTQNKVAANSALSENDAAISGVSENNLDILSNGFKLRTSNAQNNGSGSTIIFAAYAENPFKYARAR